MQRDEGPIRELEERVRRYPARRYPVQHATARFHLGVALADAGDHGGAEEALAAAAGLFDRSRLTAEHGKAMNALGAVLRLAGRADEAGRVLARAAAAFEAAGLAAEHGAARFNLGLVHREAGDLDGALDAFARAQGLFETANAPLQAAAAARELGAGHLAAGHLDAARTALETALELARRVGDEAGAGAAANVLGLVELGDDRPHEAVRAFGEAAVAHPRSIRPEGYAVARANLALAHEAAGDPLRARVAARQGLGVPGAPDPVRAQAEAVLARLGPGADDVVAMLAGEDPDRRPAVVREELARWLDAGAAERRAEAGAWVDGQLARPAVAADLAEALVGGLLELPPAGMEAAMRGLVEALRERDPGAQERFRSDVARAAARFHVPQLVRLRDGFNRLAAELGEEPAWR